MTKRQIEQAYDQYDRLLHKLSHHYASQRGRREEDCYGQACWLFMQATSKYKPGGIKFSTFLYTYVRNGLGNWTWGMRNDTPPDPEHLPEQTATLTPDRQLMFKDWLANLSEECREVAMIILNGPAEVLEIGTGGCRKITAGMIKAYLRGRGWTYPRIWQTMRDLKEAVRTI